MKYLRWKFKQHQPNQTSSHAIFNLSPKELVRPNQPHTKAHCCKRYKLRSPWHCAFSGNAKKIADALRIFEVVGVETSFERMMQISLRKMQTQSESMIQQLVEEGFQWINITPSQMEVTIVMMSSNSTDSLLNSNWLSTDVYWRLLTFYWLSTWLLWICNVSQQ